MNHSLSLSLSLSPALWLLLDSLQAIAIMSIGIVSKSRICWRDCERHATNEKRKDSRGGGRGGLLTVWR